jgi:hypothetical protein
METKTFDTETFAKMVALFDSNSAGEAESAFRKAVLMCAKNGLHFGEAAGMAFGKDGGEVAELRDLLQRQEADYAGKLTWSADEIQRLNGALAAALSGNGGGDGEEEHVIDLGGRLRRAWVFPQFRLLVLTLAISVGAGAGQHHDALGSFFAVLCFFLFGAWSVAQFRKRGLGQMFLKWFVYGTAVILGGVLVDGVDAGNRPAVFLAVLAVALVLTLTKVSEWLGEQVRMHVWESESVHVVRGWF